MNFRSQVQNHTNTKYMKLQDFPDGKMLKINRRNNSRHYRVYQKDQGVRVLINDRGIQVSSYSISETKLRQFIKNDFWVLTKRNFN